MGNQLTATAPSQILSLESYLSEVPDVTFYSSLGSTRFMKVARAVHKEGHVVVKVFVIHDPSLQLKPYVDLLKDLNSRLNGLYNILPIEHVLLTEKCGFLLRQYVHHNLYDRLNTRPFLTLLEKKWIVFQILQALSQSHSVKICHGDVKAENILVTSWNWVLLTDFAPYKPTYLPANHPSDFYYYYATLRRQACCLAPERFHDGTSKVPDLDPSSTGDPLLTGELPRHQGMVPEMDVFSAGCVIAEIFTDGNHLFDLSQLLAYRLGSYDPEPKLLMIKDVYVRDMVRSMISLSPSGRKPVKAYIAEYRKTVFPDEFYNILKGFLIRNVALPVLSSDEKVATIHREMDNILSSLVSNQGEEYHNQDDSDNCMVIILSLILSTITSLKFTEMKILALDLLLQISQFVSDEIVLERVLPYMLHFADDPGASVRAHLVRTLTLCVTAVQRVCPDEVNVFPEFIFPTLEPLCTDTEVIVRVAMAENISVLTQHSQRFLELSQLHRLSSDSRSDTWMLCQTSYDAEWENIVSLVKRMVVQLLSDADNTVKRMMLDRSLLHLCQFLGWENINDVLLSHIVTFLNYKQDWHLRVSFFDAIVGIACHVGWSCVTMLTPMLQQGLGDTEEWVVLRVLRTLHSLVEVQLVQKQGIVMFLDSICPLLCHPNNWIRVSAARFVARVARTQHIADWYHLLERRVQPFVLKEVYQYDRVDVLLATLVPPVPRLLFDLVLRSDQARGFFDLLQSAVKSESGCYLDAMFRKDPNNILLRKMKHNSVADSTLCLLLYLRPFLQKQSQVLLASAHLCSRTVLNRGSVNLADQAGADCLRSEPIGNVSLHIQEEGLDDDSVSGLIGLNRSTASSLSDRQGSSDHQPSITCCQYEVDSLIGRRRKQFASRLMSSHRIVALKSSRHLLASRFPAGTQVAHLWEHRSGINQLAVSRSGHWIASASKDGTVRLWDTHRLGEKCVSLRSRLMYNQIAGPVRCVCFLSNSQRVACSSEEGSIHLLDLWDTEAAMGRVRLTCFEQRNLAPRSDGSVVAMQCLDGISQNVLVYATTSGSIVAWDTRVRTERLVFAYKMDPNLSAISCLAIDPFELWLACGTHGGAVVLWDLRFGSKVSRIHHPAGHAVMKMTPHPSVHSMLIASFKGNNEVSILDLEAQLPVQTFWASPASPLAYSSSSVNSVTALCTASHQSLGDVVFLGSTDKRIRMWDLGTPVNSMRLVGADSDQPSSHYTYTGHLIDGLRVTIENSCNADPASDCKSVSSDHATHRRSSSGAQSPSGKLIGDGHQAANCGDDVDRRAGGCLPHDDCLLKSFDQSLLGHRNVVSDVVWVPDPLNLLVSCSLDGVVRVWK